MTRSLFPGLPRLAAALAMLAALALPAGPASAATTISVNSNFEWFPGDGLCELREAIVAANTDTAVDACPAGSGADTIVLPMSTFILTVAGTGEDAALTGDLDITADLTLTGAGTGLTTINGNGIDRVIHIVGTPTVSISGITITGGNAGLGGGGGISNVAGTLTLTDVNVTGNATAFGGGGITNSTLAVLTINGGSVTNNIAGSGHGGGIYNIGALTVTNSTLSGNSAAYLGGGLTNTGTATITNSTLSGNSAGSNGGGIYNTSMLYVPSPATVTVTNSTLSGNSASSSGGGIYDDIGTVTLNNATIANNTADSDANGYGDGGGVFVTSTSTLNFGNTIIAGNADNSVTTQHKDCSGKLTSLGYNLVQKVVGCTVAGVGGNLFKVDPLLGPLQGNGGATWTQALPAGSVAIDAGNPKGCKDSSGAVLTSDQRGDARPLDGDGNGKSVCDMGAYEY